MGLPAPRPRELQLADTAGTVLALIVLAILVIRRERLPRPWLWLTGTVFAAYLLIQLVHVWA